MNVLFVLFQSINVVIKAEACTKYKVQWIWSSYHSHLLLRSLVQCNWECHRMCLWFLQASSPPTKAQHFHWRQETDEKKLNQERFDVHASQKFNSHVNNWNRSLLRNTSRRMNIQSDEHVTTKHNSPDKSITQICGRRVETTMHQSSLFADVNLVILG